MFIRIRNIEPGEIPTGTALKLSFEAFQQDAHSGSRLGFCLPVVGGQLLLPLPQGESRSKQRTAHTSGMRNATIQGDCRIRVVGIRQSVEPLQCHIDGLRATVAIVVAQEKLACVTAGTLHCARGDTGIRTTV